MTVVDTGNTLAVVAREPSVEYDLFAEMPCQGCGSTDAEFDDLALLCDGCGLCWHTFCVGLGETVPEEKWYCPTCSTENNGHQPATTISDQSQPPDIERKEAVQDDEVTTAEPTPELDVFQCILCDKVFGYKHTLKRHMTLYHAQSPEQYQCQVCLYETPRKDTLSRHITRWHPRLEQGHR